MSLGEAITDNVIDIGIAREWQAEFDRIIKVHREAGEDDAEFRKWWLRFLAGRKRAAEAEAEPGRCTLNDKADDNPPVDAYEGYNPAEPDHYVPGSDPKESAKNQAEAEKAAKVLRAEQRNKKLFDEQDATTLAKIFALERIEARYNTRAHRIDLRSHDSDWHPLNDRSEASLRDHISVTYQVLRYGGVRKPMHFGRERWEQCLNAVVFKHQVDPFVDWLDSSPEWDGIKRLDTLLIDLFGAEDTPLNRWASRYACIGAIQRTHQPGCKLDETPVLIGAQDTGKSSFLRRLLPDDCDEWFSDSLVLSDSTKKQVESLQGCVLAEISEMSGSTKSEIERLKAFLSRTDDGNTRLTYRRNPEHAPRRCVFYGTTNRSDCLPNDPSGNRRLVPVEIVRGAHIEPYMDGHREQLWAEAIVQYLRGTRANLPRDLKAQAATIAERHRNRDEAAETFVAEIPMDRRGYSLTGLLDMHKCPRELQRNNGTKRLAQVLRQLGWQNIKKHGKNRWFNPAW